MKLIWDDLKPGETCGAEGSNGRQWLLKRVSRPTVSIYVVELWEGYPKLAREFHKIENAKFAAQELEDALCQRPRK